MEYPEYEVIRKYNNGNGAILCNCCSVILLTGKDAWDLPNLPQLCEKCWYEFKLLKRESK